MKVNLALSRELERKKRAGDAIHLGATYTNACKFAVDIISYLELERVEKDSRLWRVHADHHDYFSAALEIGTRAAIYIEDDTAGTWVRVSFFEKGNQHPAWTFYVNFSPDAGLHTFSEQHIEADSLIFAKAKELRAART